MGQLACPWVSRTVGNDQCAHLTSALVHQHVVAWFLMPLGVTHAPHFLEQVPYAQLLRRGDETRDLVKSAYCTSCSRHGERRPILRGPQQVNACWEMSYSRWNVHRPAGYCSPVVTAVDGWREVVYKSLSYIYLSRWRITSVFFRYIEICNCICVPSYRQSAC